MTNQLCRIRDTAKHCPAKWVLSGVLGSIPGSFFFSQYCCCVDTLDAKNVVQVHQYISFKCWISYFCIFDELY